MIKITHTCFYTNSHTTEIRFRNEQFQSIGVPLNVLLHAFKEINVVWFSSMYGQWNDNILLIGVSETVGSSLPKQKYIEESPMTAAWVSDSEFEEYLLTEEIQKTLDIVYDSVEQHFTSVSHESILFEIYIHDDCFSYIEPVDKELQYGLLDAVLELHGYYLGIETVDWSEIRDILLEDIKRDTINLIKSHPGRDFLSLRKTGIVSYLKTKLIPSLAKTIIIEDGKAKFSERYLHSRE
jgi:hypothetical protein